MTTRGLTVTPLIALAIPIILLTTTGPAAAQPQWSLEAVGGLYVMDLDPLDEDPAFGFRVVRETGARWSLEAQVLRLSADLEREFAIIAIAPPPPGALTNLRIDYEAIALDLSARLRLLPEYLPVQLHLLGGPGWGFVDGEVHTRLSNGARERTRSGGFLDDSLTAHLGLALDYDLAESWYLRFDARTRYWDERESNDTDAEYTLGVGFRL